MDNNQFYNSAVFNFLKVNFSQSQRLYTYAAHRRYNLNVGDLVIVPTGNIERMFNQDYPHELLKIVKIDEIITDFNQLSLEYDLKHIVGKVNSKIYNRILDAKLSRLS